MRIRNGFPSERPASTRSASTPPPTCTGRRRCRSTTGTRTTSPVPGFVKTYHYPNTDRASTLWYHDHRHLVTAQNVYSGLAAFYPLLRPVRAGAAAAGRVRRAADDLGCVVQRRRFAGASASTDDKGLWGDIILVNGVPWPTMKVKPRIYRFRVLIASIGRSYRPTLSNGDPVYIVGTDDGMVPVVQPVRVLAAGHRGALRDPRRLPQAQGRPDRRPAQPEQQEQHRLRRHRQDHAVPGGGRLRAGLHRHRHPHHPGPWSAARTRPAAALDDEPDAGDGRRETPAQVRARTAASGRSTGSRGRTWRPPGSPSCSPTPSRSASSSGRSSTTRVAGSTRSTST